METLKNYLKNWTDFDIAMHIIAVHLEMLDESERFIDNKGYYFTENKLSNTLSKIIDELIKLVISNTKSKINKFESMINLSLNFKK